MKSPKPPDPYKTAAAQQKAEVGAAGASSVMNNPNVVTPYGSQSYSISGWEQVPDAQGRMITVPRYTQTQTLSPDQQRLMALQTQMQYNTGQTGVEQSAKLRQHLQGSIDPSQWQAWNAGPQAANLATDFGGQGEYRQDQGPTDRAAIERAMMENYTQDTQGQHQAQDAQMAARGLSPGSAQYGGMYQQREQARGRAGREAYLASGDEARQAQNAFNQAQQQRYQEALGRAGFSNEALSQMYNMAGSTADRANALRGMQSQEAFALRNQPINEIAALMQGSQVTLPQFSPYQGQGINSANIGQYIGNNYAQQQQAAGQFNTGLFNVGAAAAGAIPMVGPPPEDRHSSYRRRSRRGSTIPVQVWLRSVPVPRRRHGRRSSSAASRRGHHGQWLRSGRLRPARLKA